MDKSWPRTSHIGSILDLGKESSFIVINNPCVLLYQVCHSLIAVLVHDFRAYPQGNFLMLTSEKLSMCLDSYHEVFSFFNTVKTVHRVGPVVSAVTLTQDSTARYCFSWGVGFIAVL